MVNHLVMFYRGKTRLTYMVTGAAGLHEAVSEALAADEGYGSDKAECTSESTFSNLRDAARNVQTTIDDGGIDYLDGASGVMAEKDYVIDAGMHDEVVVVKLA